MSEQDTVWDTLSLFEGFTPAEMQKIKPWIQEKSFAKGDYLIREGEKGSELYWILQGQVEVLKQDTDHIEHRINCLDAGKVVGEMVLFQQNQRSASVRALKSGKALVLEIDAVKKQAPELERKIVNNFAGHLTERLQESNQLAVLSLKKMYYKERKLNAMNHLTLQIFVILVAYQCIVRIFLAFTKANTLNANTLIELPLMLAITYFAYRLIRKERYPLSMWGLTFRRWKKAVWESLLMTIPLMGLIVLIKWGMIHFLQSYADSSLFSLGFSIPHSFFHTPTLTFAKIAVAFYVLSAPLQEFLIRGVLQTALQRASTQGHRIFFPILVSNLIFAAGHEPLSWIFPIAIFIPGVIWGILYFRHRTLVGVSLSHLIIGIFALYVVGFSP